MKKRDIVIGFVILAVLAGIIYWVRRPVDKLKVPSTPSVEEKIEGVFNIEIPEDAEKAQLEDVTGGDASGIATRSYEDGRFTHVVLADLPDPEVGSFYEAWLVRGNNFVSTGKLRIAKGGYLLEFESGVDYSDFDEVVVTLETVEDRNPEQYILEGSF